MDRRNSKILKLIAYGLLAVGALNTGFSLWKYGFEQGLYFWFCNLALLLTPASILFARQQWTLGIFSTAVLTQPPWILDNLVRPFTGENLIGVAEFLYHPGMPLAEFILSHHHFILMPFLLTALWIMPRSEKTTYPQWIAGGTLLTILISQLFPFEQNINCALHGCLPVVAHLKGPLYSAAFGVAVILASCLVAYLSDLTLKILKERMQAKWWMGTGATYSILFICFLGYDISYKSKLPQFECSRPFEDSTISVRCRYTTEYDPDIMLLVYQIHNKTDHPLECNSRINMVGQPEDLHKGIFMKPKDTFDIPVLLPYPLKDTKASLMASCRRN